MASSSHLGFDGLGAGDTQCLVINIFRLLGHLGGRSKKVKYGCRNYFAL